MIFTNNKKHGGTFRTQFMDRVKKAKKLTIATGYFGADLVREVESKLVAISKRGECRILLGMVFHGGVSEKQRKCIAGLDSKLRAINPDNGVYISRKDYHGKIYQIDEEVYIGSSNFSKEGFDTRWECTATINDSQSVAETTDYLDFLFSQKTTAKLRDVQLNTKAKVGKIKPSKQLTDYIVKALPAGEIVSQQNITLRVDRQPASSLNLYFDKGRKNKNGLYAPRPWYEIEITASAKDRSDPCYPHSKLKVTGKKSREGTFNAYIEEGSSVYMLKMKVASDNGKALMTGKASGGRETLGRYIKGKLENANVLKHGERITSDVLEAYGRDYITLKKIDDENYILEF